MTVATHSVVTAALAAAVALAGFYDPRAVVVVAGLLVLLFAVGWPTLAALPMPPGSSAVVALTGVGAVAAVWLVGDAPQLSALAVVMASALVLAFVNELLRRDGRERLIESVSGTVAGSVVALCAAGWIACSALAGGESLVVVGALALAVGSAVAALAVPRWLSVVTVVAAAAAVGALGGAAVPGVDLRVGALLGLAVGVLVAALDSLFDNFVVLERRTPALAAVALPVAVSGMVVYIVGRVLVG